MTNANKKRALVIKQVNTPIKFIALIVLVVEVILLVSWVALKEEDQFARVLVLCFFIGIILLCLISVICLAIFRPEALKGERRPLTASGDSQSGFHNPQFSSDKLFQPPSNKYGVFKVGFFENYNDLFYEKIRNTNSLTLMFIHSRRWRENHNETIRTFLLKKRARLTVFLPNLRNSLLLKSLKVHFNDGDHLPSFISDAYRYFSDLMRRFPEKVEIRAYDLYPVYSFYKFDSKLFIAMYPNTANKRSVPTLELTDKGEFWDFVHDDLQVLLRTTTPLSEQQLEPFADINRILDMKN